MERISFTSKGHKNILGRHRNTLEFTKDKELSLEGDCIIGVDSDFTFEMLRPVLEWKKAKMIVECSNIKEEITGNINPLFKSDHEIVLRITDFGSERTLMTRCDKASKDLSREFVDCLKKSSKEINVEIYKIE